MDLYQLLPQPAYNTARIHLHHHQPNTGLKPPAAGHSPAALTVFSFHFALLEMGQVPGDARK